MDNSPQPPKKLTRIKEGQIIAGVCTGLAKYFNVDVVLVRVVFVALLFAGGSGVLLYILLALIIPPDDSSGKHENVERDKKPEPDNQHHHTSQAASANSGDTVKEFVDTMKDNAQKVAEEVRHSRGSFNSTRNIAAMVIVAVGVLALFNSLTGFRVFRWDLLWPIVLIFIGAFILFKRK